MHWVSCGAVQVLLTALYSTSPEVQNRSSTSRLPPFCLKPFDTE
ncbi:MAG: hypothetical protein ACREEC_06450 [Thermoplasmata archaeon]